MKPKAGLHRKISSIFDGVPARQNPAVAPNTVKTQADGNSSLPQQSSSAGGSEPSGAVTTTKTPQNRQLRKVVKTGRPGSGNRHKPVAITAWLKELRTVLYGGKQNAESARQRKMAVLAAVLAVVLAAVLFLALSPGPQKTKAAPKTGSPEQQTQAAAKKEITWSAPEEFPENFPDPTRYRTSSQAVSGADTDGGAEGGLIVKGIVYSASRPSAIINSDILFEGEKINDITVVKIDRDSVRFEKNGKKWTQSVQ